MAETKQKLWSREELLDLLDDEDIEALWDKWGLPATERKSRGAPEFIAALEARSKTSLLQDVLRLRTPTLRMLRDVLTFLIDQNAAVRTTGSQVVLEDEFDIAPQEVNAALLWSASVVRRHVAATWGDLSRRFDEEIVPLFSKIARYGEVEVFTRREDPMKVAIRTERGGSPIMGRTVEVDYDAKGLEARKEYVKQLSDLNRKLTGLGDLDLGGSAGELVGKLKALWRQHHSPLEDDLNDINWADERNIRSSGMKIDDDEKEIWRRFVEDLLFLSDLEESSEVVDVLRMDLFRKRPQLYELWILVSILKFMRRAGYKIEMLTLRTTEGGRIVWNLNYARSSTAVARLLRATDSSEYYLFYQLFRPGERRNDMPDIALLPSDRAGDRPVWIMDPKHSERGGYALKDYQEVGLRYQATFTAQRTWIVEYFARPDLGVDNPLSFAADVQLIRDVAPDRAGFAWLLRALEVFHGCPVGATLAVIDVSGSFLPYLNRVKDDLRKLRADGVGLSDDIVWFGEKAARVEGCLAALEQDNLELPQDLGAGTAFSPALVLVEALLREASVAYAVRLYTDGEFDDISMGDALERLHRLAEVEVINFAVVHD